MNKVFTKKLFLTVGLMLVMTLVVAGCDFVDSTDDLDDDISESGEVELYLSGEGEEVGALHNLNNGNENSFPDKDLDNVEEINVVIESILINHKDGEGWQQMDFEGPQMVNLLDPELYSEPVAEGAAAAGEYDMIRLMAEAEYDEEDENEEGNMEDSDIEAAEISDKSHVVYEAGEDGEKEVEELFIQAAASAGIKVHGDFTVGGGEEQAITLAFAAEDLLVERGPNEPMLRPAAFHLEEGEPEDEDPDEPETGTITGSIELAEEVEELTDESIVVDVSTDGAEDQVTLDEESETVDYTLAELDQNEGYTVNAEINWDASENVEESDYFIIAPEDETVTLDEEEVDGPVYEVTDEEPEDVEESLDITDVEEIADKNVEYGTEFAELDLPEEVEVTLEDESIEELEVNWQKGDYDGEEAATYTVEGELVLTENIENPEDLKAAVDVTVETEDQTASAVELYFNQETDSETASILQGPPDDNRGPPGFEDVAEINVVLESISFNNKDGSGWEQLTDFGDETIQVDLLDSDLAEDPIVEEDINPGEYEMIRLFAAAEYDEEDENDEENMEDSEIDAAEISDKSHVVYDDGGKEELFIQAAANAGIKVHGDFTVDEGDEKALTIGFAAEDLLVERGPNNPMLRPAAFHLEEGEPEDEDPDEIETGTITGSVVMAEETEELTNGSIVVDVSTEGAEDQVTLDEESETVDYTLAELDQNEDYTVNAEINWDASENVEESDYFIIAPEDETVTLDEKEVDGPVYEVTDEEPEEPEDPEIGNINGQIEFAAETELEDEQELDVRIEAEEAGNDSAVTSTVVTFDSNMETEDYSLEDIEFGTYQVTAEIDETGEGVEAEEFAVELVEGEGEEAEVEVDAEDVDGPDFVVVEADVDPEDFTVSLTDLDGAGSVDVDDETLEAEGDSVDIEAETEITIAADADESWEFVEWSQDADGEEEVSFETTISEDYDIGVVFEEVEED